MPPAKTHEECRRVCCLLCKRKGKDNRPLSVGNKIAIKTNFLLNYDDVQHFLPGGLCGSRRGILTLRFGNNPKSRPTNLPIDEDSQYFQNMIEELSKLPRGVGSRSDCSCFMCSPAKTVFVSQKKIPGVPKAEFSNDSSRDNRTLDEDRVEAPGHFPEPLERHQQHVYEQPYPPPSLQMRGVRFVILPSVVLNVP